MERRHFFKHLAAASASSLLSLHVPRWSAYAQVGESRPHFFIYIFASGGWDPTQVFEIKPGLSSIDVDPGADAVQSGNINYFHNTDRPWVKTFFDDFYSQCCIINGVNTQSVSHEVGTEIMMTGDAGVPRPDWPTIISSETGPDLLLPHMALSGPSYSGTLGSGTSSGTGFISLLLFEGSWTAASATTEATLDAYTQRRFETLMERYTLEGRTGSKFQEMEESFRRWRELKDIKNDLGDEFTDLDGLGGEGVALATAFERGYAITGTLEARASWDSHSNNNGQQNQGFDNTFQGLHEIVTHLSNRPATSGSGTLLDQTTLMVMSEMGRTPKLNGSNGKDHWPITSVLMVGGGVSGNKVIGSTDDFQNSELVDFQTGQVSSSGLEISSANIGSTLLSMAGLNPNDFLPSTVPAFTAFRSGA
ncbi:MAG: DUF1501 domain-containing protein [Candidatus Omnitrophica bacterium]|nr:DUF1501 domain-containing protein [Candidatus Omnitrophota bacterium]